MRRLLSRYFPRKRLVGLSKPTYVDVRGVVSNTRTVQSLLTNSRAVAFRISWVEGLTRRDGQHESGGIRFSPAIASAWMGSDFSIACEDRTIAVPIRGLMLVAAVDLRDATPLVTKMPPEFAYLLDRPRSGRLYFREHAIYEGDPIRLEALVAPIPRAGGYREMARSSTTADFTVVDGSDATLHDLSAGGI